SSLTLETMMAAGMHLGHSASLWNPMNLPYIFGEREGIHVINLEVTMAALRRSAHFVRQVAYHGGLVLFAGARKDHRQMAVDAALLAEQYFVTGKWIPGTLTNPRPLLGKHIMYVEDIWDEEKAKLKKEGDGLKTYKPDLIIALNPLECKTMLAECKLAHVPTVGIVDTNCDPRLVTYPVPCNDDSMRAVAIVAGVLARAAKEGMDMRKL
ncbi:ribosomal protein S2, flavodoxin-like domain-containing protein, partial [Kickxella alabastrina]|uniref:ribosomal protein S2, flavodoxin-like domain-containing protein n=1 Tax=Kickxella alabastrina TaxID=61397 RepID=UPI00221E7EFC